MPLVFITPYKKTYSSEFCSLSTFIGLIFLVLAILIPFFAAFSSEDFWLRLKEYMEQPIVEFDNHYMLYITTFNDSNNPTGTYLYSSNNKLNEIFDNISNNNLNTNSHLENNARITDAKSDEDNDGINDKIIINYETSNNDIIKAEKKDSFILYETDRDSENVWFLCFTSRDNNQRLDSFLNVMQFDRIWIPEEINSSAQM